MKALKVKAKKQGLLFHLQECPNIIHLLLMLLTTIYFFVVIIDCKMCATHYTIFNYKCQMQTGNFINLICNK